MADKPRILTIATTPGPAQALAEAVRGLSAWAQVTVLTSSDPRQGQGGAVFARYGIPTVTIESILSDYRPLDVRDDQARALLARFSPNAVLAGAVNEPSGERYPIEDMLCWAATRAGLANAQFIEGWDVWQPRRWGPPPAAIYLAVDTHAAAMLRHNGVPADRLRVVGYSPSLIDPEHLDKNERGVVRAELGLGDADRLIVFYGQVTPNHPVTLGWLANVLGPRDRLLFQRHPRDGRALDLLLADCPRESVKLSSLPTHRVIHATDVCVTHFSLVSFTAAVMGIPTILTLLQDDVPNIRRILGGYPTTLLKGSVECYDRDGLARALAEARPPEDSFVEQVRDAAAGFSASVTASLLKALARHPA